MCKLDNARVHLATVMMNDGSSWEECCDSVEVIERRLRSEGHRNDGLITQLRVEAYRYEDM